MESDTARVLVQGRQGFRIPSAIVRPECLLAVPFHSRSVGQQDGLAGLLVPLVEMFYRVPKVLKRQHIDKRFRGVDHFHRNRRVGLVAVAQDQVMFVVTPDRIVGRLVIAVSQFGQFLATRFRFQAFRIKHRAAPGVVRSLVNPARAVAVEVTDQVRIIGQFRAVGSCDVIAPFLPALAAEVVVDSVLFPLMRFGEGQQVAVGHAQRLVFVIGERTRVPPLANGHLLHPTHGVETP